MRERLLSAMPPKFVLVLSYTLVVLTLVSSAYNIWCSASGVAMWTNVPLPVGLVIGSIVSLVQYLYRWGAAAQTDEDLDIDVRLLLMVRVVFVYDVASTFYFVNHESFLPVSTSAMQPVNPLHEPASLLGWFFSLAIAYTMAAGSEMFLAVGVAQVNRLARAKCTLSGMLSEWLDILERWAGGRPRQYSNKSTSRRDSSHGASNARGARTNPMG